MLIKQLNVLVNGIFIINYNDNVIIQELFWLLDDDNDEVPSGKITATSLALELAAGGVSPEHTQFVRKHCY